MRGWALLMAGILPAALAAGNPGAARSTTQTTPASAPAGNQIQENLELLTGENSPQARRAAASKILEFRSDTALKAIEDILSGTSVLGAQIAACEAIAEMPQPPPLLIGSLVKRLGDPAPGLGDAAARALRHYPPQTVVPAIGTIAQDRVAPINQRIAAIACLGAAGDDLRAVQILVGLLDAESPTIQATALAALSAASGVTHRTVSEAKDWWKLHASLTPAQWVQKLCESRREQLHQAEWTTSHLTRRLASLSRESFLAAPKSQKSQKLISLLTDELAALRTVGLDLINDQITDRREVDPEIKKHLAGMLSDSDPQIRARVAKISSELRLDGAYQAITAALAEEKNLDVRAALVSALGRLDQDAAIPLVMKYLDDESPAVIGESALALGTLSRRRVDGNGSPNGVVKALLERFNRLADEQSDLRLRFVQAMARVADPEFLPILCEQARKGAMAARIAAIAGLSAYESPAAIKEIRSQLEAEVPEVRLASAEALGRCGREHADLKALARHLDGPDEPDARVRDQAWRSYLAIMSSLPPDMLIQVAKDFDIPGDRTAQERQLELLRIIHTDPERFERLPPEQQITLIARMSRTQDVLGDHGAAAAGYERAADLIRSSSGSPDEMVSRCFRSRLLAHQDEKALAILAGISSNMVNGHGKLLTSLGESFATLMDERISRVVEPAELSATLALIQRASPILEDHGFGDKLSLLNQRALSRHGQLIDDLLGTFCNNPESERKIDECAPESVIPRLVEKLQGMPAGRKSEDLNCLIDLGRKLAPDWNGFSPDADTDERQTALDELSGMVNTSG